MTNDAHLECVKARSSEDNVKVAAEQQIDLGQCAVLHSVIFRTPARRDGARCRALCAGGGPGRTFEEAPVSTVVPIEKRIPDVAVGSLM